MKEYDRTTIVLDDETKELMRKFRYVDNAKSRTDLVVSLMKFREDLDDIPSLKGLPMERIIKEVRMKYGIFPVEMFQFPATVQVTVDGEALGIIPKAKVIEEDADDDTE
jgi:hypothetical protein